MTRARAIALAKSHARADGQPRLVVYDREQVDVYGADTSYLVYTESAYDREYGADYYRPDTWGRIIAQVTYTDGRFTVDHF